jgi:hypothetical protein
MKIQQPIYLLLVCCGILLVTSCSDYETYGEKKQEERDAISSYITANNIQVISQTQFAAQGDSTSVEKNQYVYFDNSAVYMQIISKGNGSVIPNGQTNLLARFSEYSIMSSVYTYSNFTTPYLYDKLTVTRSDATFTASFDSGQMYSVYGASVPSGWLIPLNYVKVGRYTTDNEIAHVKLIVPHTQGTSTASGNVYPYAYEIYYQQEK